MFQNKQMIARWTGNGQEKAKTFSFLQKKPKKKVDFSGFEKGLRK